MLLVLRAREHRSLACHPPSCWSRTAVGDLDTKCLCVIALQHRVVLSVLRGMFVIPTRCVFANALGPDLLCFFPLTSNSRSANPLTLARLESGGYGGRTRERERKATDGRVDEGDSITVSQQQAIHSILLFQRAIHHLLLIKTTWLRLGDLNEIGVQRLISSIRNVCYLYARSRPG